MVDPAPRLSVSIFDWRHCGGTGRGSVLMKREAYGRLLSPAGRRTGICAREYPLCRKPKTLSVKMCWWSFAHGVVLLRGVVAFRCVVWYI